MLFRSKVAVETNKAVAVEVKEKGLGLECTLKLEPGIFAGRLDVSVGGASVKGDGRGFGTSSKELGGWGCRGLRREGEVLGEGGGLCCDPSGGCRWTVRETNLGLTGVMSAGHICLQPVEMCVYINMLAEGCSSLPGTGEAYTLVNVAGKAACLWRTIWKLDG